MPRPRRKLGSGIADTRQAADNAVELTEWAKKQVPRIERLLASAEKVLARLHKAMDAMGKR